MARQLTTPDRVMLLMSLVPYLMEHGPTPLVDLAKTFNVDVQVLRRLVQFLGVAGVPGETRTYQHEDLFDIDWEALEQHDVVNLTRVVAVDDIPRFSSTETAALVAGLHELSSMLPDAMRSVAQTTAAKLASLEAVDMSSASVSVTESPAHEHLVMLSGAIANERQLSFIYRDGHGNLTQRHVVPLLLEQSSSAWYLRAFCFDREAERTFLIDRMRELRKIDESQASTLPTDRVKTAQEMDSVAGFAAREGITVTLLLRHSTLHRIADFAPQVHQSSSNQAAPVASGWVRADVELLHPAVAIRLVQASPGEVVIEAPESARLEVKQWAERALASYGE